ncbi:hypothetical protein OUZ56_024528 [Daphnia magna]|uniref:Uncharacterized protein n=1 Tax=Daphnia magna TaxID=35525 RepID=A0ABR0B0W2_9CRUS|nr:hypothetical protein OUZ56_024528 [Daphnia magna]
MPNERHGICLQCKHLRRSRGENGYGDGGRLQRSWGTRSISKSLNLKIWLEISDESLKTKETQSSRANQRWIKSGHLERSPLVKIKPWKRTTSETRTLLPQDCKTPWLEDEND